MTRAFLLGIPLILITSLAAQDQPSSSPSAIALPAVRDEILRRRDLDQKARLSLVEAINMPGSAGKAPPPDQKLLDELRAIDEANMKWMKEVVAKHGWPGRSLVGDDGASAAWLLIQHADRDRSFQKECLALMHAMPPGEVRGENIAYLEDRVLVGEGKPQRYGTQTQELNGAYRPLPIEDEPNVDERRKKLGMPPLAEYLKQIEALYRPKELKQKTPGVPES